jgi:hypothetical protein
MCLGRYAVRTAVAGQGLPSDAARMRALLLPIRECTQWLFDRSLTNAACGGGGASDLGRFYVGIRDTPTEPGSVLVCDCIRTLARGLFDFVHDRVRLFVDPRRRRLHVFLEVSMSLIDLLAGAAQSRLAARGRGRRRRVLPRVVGARAGCDEHACSRQQRARFGSSGLGHAGNIAPHPVTVSLRRPSQLGGTRSVSVAQRELASPPSCALPHAV